MWGGEAHLAVDVVLSPSITALTPPGPYFCMLVFAPLKPFGMDKHLPLQGNSLFYVSDCGSSAIFDMFRICVGAVVDLM